MAAVEVLWLREFHHDMSKTVVITASCGGSSGIDGSSMRLEGGGYGGRVRGHEVDVVEAAEFGAMEGKRACHQMRWTGLASYMKRACLCVYHVYARASWSTWAMPACICLRSLPFRALYVCVCTRP